MLILTRRPGESLYVGKDIRITVLGAQGRQIKLGLEVPPDTTVYREEVYKRVIEENRQALAASREDMAAVLGSVGDLKKNGSHAVADELWQKAKK